MSKRDSLLRVALLGNAAFSTLCAAVLLAEAGALSPHLSAPVPWLYGLAAGLGVFAASLVWQATRPVVNPLSALLTSVADLGWVAGSAALLAFWPDAFSNSGALLVEGVALFVFASAVAQLLGLRRSFAEPDPAVGTRCRVEVEVEVEAPADAMWKVVSDLPGIHRYAPDLAESRMRGDDRPRAGAVRECANTKGQRWAERCVGWEPGHAFSVEFQTHEDGFPFPMDPMLGGWRIEPAGADRSRVSVWWSFNTQPRWAELLIVPLMARSAHSSFPEVIEAMARAARDELPSHGVPPSKLAPLVETETNVRGRTLLRSGRPASSR